MTNKLAQSTSPYLQQHADNPVHWQEWGPEALEMSRQSGKPILLSVGYSACHWCHVMAHESFEDSDVAAIMNGLFINIKVDREERPDIDQIYQTAHAMLTQRSGGWPLTMFLTPETKPFFGGTYFPKTARYGLPGFGDLLGRVAQYYRDHQDDIAAQNEQLIAALNRSSANPDGDTEAKITDFSREPIEAGYQEMARSFDSKRGGFGTAPKFPHPEMIEFCLRRTAGAGNAESQKAASHVACFTLERMCKGGIFDQLGGGFARYSVDAEWTIPHFEKMLYDNGPLLRLLADAWLVSEDSAQKALFKRCAEQTAAWVMREMQPAEGATSGGYFSTLDADSEGHEGKFYVWTLHQVERLLTSDEYLVIAQHYGLDQPANFEIHFWNLTVAASLDDVATALGLPIAQCEALLATARSKLFNERETRIRPGRDEKILTSWNAMMIEGMAHAGRVFGRADWVASARRALTFVRKTMWNPDTDRLFATHKDGKTHLNAYLDDYAFLIKALIEMLQSDFRPEDLKFALQVADVLLDQFEDPVSGGFFFTSHDHEQLIQRPKPGHDNATPSGNGVAALVLQRLSHLTNDLRYADAAQKTLGCFFDQMEDHPSGFGSLLMALEEQLHPPRVVILTGPENSLPTFQTALATTYLPSTVVLPIGNGSAPLPEAVARPATSEVNAYVCQGVRCLAPIVDIEKLQESLKMPIVSD
jgi:uncharacterized protein YyaL (SSP411 family)